MSSEHSAYCAPGALLLHRAFWMAILLSVSHPRGRHSVVTVKAEVAGLCFIWEMGKGSHS